MCTALWGWNIGEVSNHFIWKLWGRRAEEFIFNMMSSVGQISLVSLCCLQIYQIGTRLLTVLVTCSYEFKIVDMTLVVVIDLLRPYLACVDVRVLSSTCCCLCIRLLAWVAEFKTM